MDPPIDDASSPLSHSSAVPSRRSAGGSQTNPRRRRSSAFAPLWIPGGSQTNRYPDLVELATTQAGVLHRAQLRDLGWNAHRVEREIRMDRWTAVAPNVVVMQNGPLQRAQQLWLGVLHAGSGSALTHLTACIEAGLRWEGDETIHVVTTKGDLVTPLAGFVFHQTRRPFHQWPHPSASPLRVGIEAAALLTAERDSHFRRAMRLLASVVQQRLTTAERLMQTGLQITKLRHGAEFRLVLGDIAGGAQSFAEIDMGGLCAARGIVPPRRQAIRKDAGGRRRYLDCEWDLADGRVLVLEIDGSFHMRTENWWKDMQRERAVVTAGRVVLRCASVEIRLEPESIARDLLTMGVPRLTSGFVWTESA